LDHFSDNGFNTLESSGVNLIHDVQVLAVPTTVTVYYKPQYQVTIIASPSQGGIVSPASGNFYDSGATVSLSAVANPGYTFVQWTGVAITATGPMNIICSSASCPVPVSVPVTWTASFAAQTVAVPNVIGSSQAAASAAITAAGLTVGSITSASSTTAPSGDVISESPVAGTMVIAGSTVNLVISSGPPPDTTPPVIVPQVVGTGGNNGWYLSSVTVNWSVADPDSGIASSTGCGPTTLTTTTSGTTLTCTANNGAGLSKSVSTTIKIDLTHPSLNVPATLTATAVSSAGAPVTYSVTATDVIDPNPVVACLPASGSTFAIGTTTVTCTATAVSGSRSTGTFNVIVANQPTPGFTLSASPTTVSVAQGGSGTTTITMTDVGGFSGTVSLSASGLPTGVTASFAAASTAGSQVLTLSASNSAAISSTAVTVTITGTSGTLSATSSIALTITPEPSFTSGAGGTTSITVAPGATTGNTGTISVVGTNGFAGTVALSCNVSTAMTNVNDMPTCSLSPVSVVISGAPAQTSTLTVHTTAASSAENQMKKSFWPATGGTALALILFFCVPRRRRNWLAMLVLLALFVPFGAVGCVGGLGSGGGGNAGTTPGTYKVTITGTSGSLTVPLGTVTLIVQ
jgi:hypothetical protein